MPFLAEKLLNCSLSLSLSLSHRTFSSLLPLAVLVIRGPTITKKWVGPSVPRSQPLKQDPLTRLYLWMLLPWHRSILHMSCWSPGWRTSNLSKLGCENTNAISSCITWTSLKEFSPSAYSSLIFPSQGKKKFFCLMWEYFVCIPALKVLDFNILAFVF